MPQISDEDQCGVSRQDVECPGQAIGVMNCAGVEVPMCAYHRDEALAHGHTRANWRGDPVEAVWLRQSPALWLRQSPALDEIQAIRQQGSLTKKAQAFDTCIDQLMQLLRSATATAQAEATAAATRDVAARLAQLDRLEVALAGCGYGGRPTASAAATLAVPKVPKAPQDEDEAQLFRLRIVLDEYAELDERVPQDQLLRLIRDAVVKPTEELPPVLQQHVPGTELYRLYRTAGRDLTEAEKVLIDSVDNFRTLVRD